MKLRLTRDIKDLVRKLYFYCLPMQKQRVKYIKKHNVFAGVEIISFFNLENFRLILNLFDFMIM